MAKFLKPFYNEIHEKIRTTEEALYADETGHRQKGQKFWLWSFSTRNEAFFAIRKRRNGNVVREILGKEFFGILITDFWKPYLAVIARFRQWCVAHYLREFKKVEFKENKSPPEYLRFKKKVKRLFKDALSFSKQQKISTENRKKAHKRFIKRLDNIVEEFIDSDIKDVKRLTKRLALTKETNPDKIEKDLMRIVPKKDWLDFNYMLVDHGRKVCRAIKPLCPECVINRFCPSLNRFQDH